MQHYDGKLGLKNTRTQAMKQHYIVQLDRIWQISSLCLTVGGSRTSSWFHTRQTLKLSSHTKVHLPVPLIHNEL